MKRLLEIFVDGACSGNPGEAAIGVVVTDGKQVIKNISQAIGQGTNNIAEYMALIFGLQEAFIQKAKRVTAHTDSELMFYQVQGRYKIKNANLRTLNLQVTHLISGFDFFELKLIKREQNRGADKLATQALKAEASRGGRPDGPTENVGSWGGKSELQRVMYPGNAGRY